MEGTVEETTLHYLIRDFDDDCFAARKAQLKERVASCSWTHPRRASPWK
jgi:tripeptide aminopeptidase